MTNYYQSKLFIEYFENSTYWWGEKRGVTKYAKSLKKWYVCNHKNISTRIFFIKKPSPGRGSPIYYYVQFLTLFSCSPPEISLRNQRFIHLAARTYFACPSSAVPLKLRLQIEAISAVDEQKMEMTTAFLSNVYNHNFSVQSNLVQKDSINIWFYSNSIGMTTDFHSATTTQPLIQLSYH